MKTVIRIAAITLATLVTASCGDSGSDRGSKDGSTSSAWSIDRSQEEVDAMFLNFDLGFTPVRELEDKGSKDIAAFNEACKGYADALEKNAEMARAGKWPGELKGRMDRFAPLLEAERRGAVQCQDAKNLKGVEAGLRLARRDSATSAGAAIEAYLEEAKAKK